MPQPSAEETDDKPQIPLTSIAGFSDQSHFVNANWYRGEVLDGIPRNKQLTCMEHVLHETFKADEERKGMFLFGGLDDGPFVLDLIHGMTVLDHEGRSRGVPSQPAR